MKKILFIFAILVTTLSLTSCEKASYYTLVWDVSFLRNIRTDVIILEYDKYDSVVRDHTITNIPSKLVKEYVAHDKAEQVKVFIKWKYTLFGVEYEVEKWVNNFWLIDGVCTKIKVDGNTILSIMSRNPD